MDRYTYRTKQDLREIERRIDETMRLWKAQSVTIERERGRFVRMTRVAVAWTDQKGTGHRVEFDGLRDQKQNLYAVAMCLEDMRMIEKRGVQTIFEQAYGTSLSPIERQQQAKESELWALALLRLSPAANTDDIKDAYRRAMRRAHPDQGGDAREAQAINEAYDMLKKARGFV